MHTTDRWLLNEWDGARLASRRVDLEMSQAELAAAAGVSRSYVEKIERNLKTPSSVMAAKLARVLGCKTDEFYSLGNRQFVLEVLSDCERSTLSSVGTEQFKRLSDGFRRDLPRFRVAFRLCVRLAGEDDREAAWLATELLIAPSPHLFLMHLPGQEQVEYASEALQLAERLGDFSRQCTVAMLLGHAYHNTGQSRLALNAWQKMWVAAGKAKNELAVANAIGHLGREYVSIQEPGHGSELLKDAELRTEASGNAEWTRVWRSNMGRVLTAAGKLKDAEEARLQEIRACTRVDYPPVNTYEGLAEVYRFQRRFEESDETERLRLGIGQRYGDTRVIASAYAGLAGSAALQQHPELQESFYESHRRQWRRFLTGEDAEHGQGASVHVTR